MLIKFNENYNVEVVLCDTAQRVLQGGSNDFASANKPL